LKEAGLPHKRFHDLRRSFATNAINAGTPQKVVMLIGGWKTDSIFQSYNILQDESILSAMDRQREYINNLKYMED